jgi:hypothetical protein
MVAPCVDHRGTLAKMTGFPCSTTKHTLYCCNTKSLDAAVHTIHGHVVMVDLEPSERLTLSADPHSRGQVNDRESQRPIPLSGQPVTARPCQCIPIVPLHHRSNPKIDRTHDVSRKED